MRRPIELLAPAKNLESGIAAIDHGADAVYIGAQAFGARVAAGNSIEDISKLCSYAHLYGAKVYVTVNTIIYDEEWEQTTQLLEQLQSIGVDAILVQDMGLLSLHPSITLHASTQTDNRTVEKVRWLASLGFRRVVLARELSVAEIAAIHQAVPEVELEVFVHGALCVSYSGICYASEYCFSRSANRGNCAQFCRMKFDLQDANGQTIVADKHLLSLKDMCRIDALEDLLKAGVTSFKIEGRLKDITYVKNVTAAYSERLNQLIHRMPDRYVRASKGHCTYTFTPDLKKSFNRGYTDYFLHGRKNDIFSPDTPKAIGEYVGKVKEIRRNTFTVAGTASFANGDGLCFINDRGELEGFRVNKVEGNRLFPLKMPDSLQPGKILYRNNDQAFEKQMAQRTAVRKVPLVMTLEETVDGFMLSAEQCHVTFQMEKMPAEKPQRENIIRQLTKLGDTPYVCEEVRFSPDPFNFFIPSSKLADMRRQLVAAMEEQSTEKTIPHAAVISDHIDKDLPWHNSNYDRYPYMYNIANDAARMFYVRQGLKTITDAFEISKTRNPMVMQCKHCLRYALGGCEKRGGQHLPWKEPWSLVLSNGRRFRLQFQCSDCQMNIIADDE